MSHPAVLFVCLGNICRSPLAEAALRKVAGEAGLDLHIDSAGTGDWHSGEPPDSRAIATAARHGVDIRSYRARQVRAADFTRFTHILAADHQNLAHLEALQPDEATAELALILDLVEGREGQSVTDPYYGDAIGFEQTWADVLAAAHALVGRLRPAA
ncbi:low molecular weight phosphotyrosine protein phosphatase [Novosphingobium sp. MW5]|nr:low molecular weight phosphotyrosine protein phosphatase [Novosphingobium sp. MW5]